MTERAFDAERLAAMLDGRLDAAQREELLKELDESPELLELMADAAAVVGEVEAEDAMLAPRTDTDRPAVIAPVSNAEDDSRPAPPIASIDPTPSAAAPSTVDSESIHAGGARSASEEASGQSSDVIDLAVARKRKGLSRGAIGILAAAVVVGIVVAPALWKGRGGDGDPGSYATLGSLESAALPPAWNTPWDPNRGLGGDGLTAAVRAVRLGTAITDAEVAARTGDPRLADFARDVQRLLAPIPAAGAVSSYYDGLADGGVTGSAAEDALRKGRRAIVQLPDSEMVRNGAWLEAARLAAARRDAAFFATDDSHDRARRVASAEAVPADARGELTRIASGGAPSDWTALGASLTAALAALGGV